MNIIPISGMAMLSNSPIAAKQTVPAQIPFKDMLNQALRNIEETDAVKSADSYNLALGEIDNIGEVMINSQKADVALQMAVQLRNKILDAYSEVMRMNV